MKKNWNKIGAMIGFIALVCFLLQWISSIPISENFSEATKYFAYTLVFFLAFFIYFEFLKEWKSEK